MGEREIKRESCSSGQDFYSSIETKKAEVIEDLEERIKRLSQKNSRFPGSITPFEKLYYTSKDVENLNYEKDLGNPGEFPFTRGVYETMYRGKLWTMRMFSGFGTAKETNKRFKFLLEHGQTGLSIAFDMPTLMGYDSDHPRARGEVGKEGVAVCTLQNMETLFKDIPLDKVSTSMTINPTAFILLAFYVAVAEKQGVPLHKLRGTIQNDILKEYIAQKEFIFPPEPSIK
ncbi:MAG: methylmalonyl-CoA mutase family protein, partial [candidate division WOR-3 bacterium]